MPVVNLISRQLYGQNNVISVEYDLRKFNMN